MIHHLNPVKVGTALGLLIGGAHLAWSILVGIGLAQPLLNFVFWAHMLSEPFAVQAFDISAAVTLVIITTVIGYIVGYCYATIWNRVHRGA